MFPFWNTAIAPVLAAAGARRLVEIGALRGENTRQIIEHLGPETELHVIDPVPDFDPAEHEAMFPGQYIFHRDLSLNVLGDLPPMDAALVDGDHNWYTVYNELRLLREVAEKNGAPLPVLILHDVAWPYGRRDLYYNPADIPDEYRQPWRKKGMRPGTKGLLPVGGLNPTMCNAEQEGGPRNGVRTALDDFVAEYPGELRVVVLPIYFGLAIVADQERLRRQPELKAELDRLQSTKGKSQLLHLAESVRLQAMMFQHNVYYQRDDRFDRATARYLNTVKAALGNEHHLENEARIAHLEERAAAGRAPETRILRDPVRQDQETWSRLTRERTGPAGPGTRGRSFLPHTDMGRHALDHLHSTLDALLEADVEGDFVEVGTGRGGGAVFMRAWLDGNEIPGRRVYVADRFRASDEPRKVPNMPAEGVAGFRADLNIVRDAFDRFGLLDGRVRFLQGAPGDTLRDDRIGQVALLRIGPDLGDDAADALAAVYDRMAPGGIVVVDAPEGSTTRVAVDRFRSEHNIAEPLVRVDSQVSTWHVPNEAEPQRKLPEPRSAQARLPTKVETDKALDLSVVVVFYNMRREAARTLHSLSRAYQEGIEDRTYEVIVVDNGSSPDQRLDQDFVTSFGPEFRLIDLGEDAKPSPVHALNIGIQAGSGRNFALMIDGAHVLTPGVLRFGLAGIETYSPAIVATQQWYTGPGQQGDAMDVGFDQAYEDRLFEKIDWPQAGYRLFEIGNFIGDRDWLDGLWESNCMFVERSQIEQVGGFEEQFTVAGGGYANLELYERLGASPDVTVVSILGEGSFHQLHGGTTTNQPDPAERRARVFGYSQEYAEMRGRPFRGPGKPIHYVGRITSPSARRTKARRLSAKTFAEAAAPGAIDGRPTEPTPLPQELRVDFVDAVYRTLPWTGTTWLGEPIEVAPTDLLAYQEILTRVRPDVVVVTGDATPGRTAFLASMCDLLDHGRVVTVGAGESPVDHPRVTHVSGAPHDDATATKVRDLTDGGSAVVILGSLTDRTKTAKEFELYSPLVPVGSYVVVADTVVNGNPVWTGFGPGPAEALKQILTRHGEFVVDPSMEKYSLSFNPGGYLHRVS
ncbi:MAG: class I SAM-dependent methyltransferase [Acidimicrobiales bacterium]|nr:class I SAM-dependent methyltransferase [Acidimicrobiales bacterium]